MKPGHTLTISAGQYNSGLSVQTDGSASAPITITSSGSVVISGNGAGSTNGIDIGNHKYVRVLGSSWKSIRVTGFPGSGVNLGSSSQYDALKNIEVDNNGTSGITAYGSGHVLQQLVVHDNAVNITITPSATATQNTIANSWVTNSQSNTTYKTDGIRVVGSTTQTQSNSSLLFLNSIIGPGLSTGVNVQSSGPAMLQFTDCLFNNAGTANLARTAGANSPINLFRVTSFMTPHNQYGQGHAALQFTAAGNDSVRNSIFWGGAIQVSGNKPLGANNVQFKTLGNTVVLSNTFTDPKFANDVSGVADNTPVSTLANLDFSLSNSSPQVPYGLGSLMISLKQLFSSGN